MCSLGTREPLLHPWWMNSPRCLEAQAQERSRSHGIHKNSGWKHGWKHGWNPWSGNTDLGGWPGQMLTKWNPCGNAPREVPGTSSGTFDGSDGSSIGNCPGPLKRKFAHWLCSSVLSCSLSVFGQGKPELQASRNHSCYLQHIWLSWFTRSIEFLVLLFGHVFEQSFGALYCEVLLR